MSLCLLSYLLTVYAAVLRLEVPGLDDAADVLISLLLVVVVLLLLLLLGFFSAREAAQIAQSQVAWNIAEAAKWITGV